MLFYSVTEYVSFHFLNFPIQRIQGNTIYLRVNSEYRAVFISLRDFDLKHRFFKTGLCHLSALLLARQITFFFFLPVVFRPKNVVFFHQKMFFRKCPMLCFVWIRSIPFRYFFGLLLSGKSC